MSIRQNDAEGGTNGATPTTTDTGSGSPFDAITVVGTGTVQYSTTRGAHGTKSYQISSPATGDAAFVVYNAATSSVAIRFYTYITANPTGSDTEILSVRTADAAVTKIGLKTDGRLTVINAGSVAKTLTGSHPLNQWVRHELVVTVGATTSTGTILYGAYVGDGDALIASYSGYMASNTGTATLATVRYGKTANGVVTLHYDDPAVQVGGTSYIGPHGPRVNAGVDQVVGSGAPVVLNGAATSDGTVVAYAWTQTSGPAVTLTGASTATCSFTAPKAVSPQPIVLQLAVTDDFGITSTDSVTVTPLPHQMWRYTSGAWVAS